MDEKRKGIEDLQAAMESACKAGDLVEAERLAREALSRLRVLQEKMQRDVDAKPVVGVKAAKLPGQRPLRRLSTPEERRVAEFERCGVLPKVSRVYLDWNVMIRFMKQELGSLDRFIRQRQNRGLVVLFSADHVREAAQVRRENPDDREALLKGNLLYLSGISCDNYLYHAADTINHAILREESPFSVLRTLQEGASLLADEAEDLFLTFVPPLVVQRLRQAWGFDPVDFSTIVPEDVVEYLDRQMAANVPEEGGPRSFRQFLDQAAASHPQHESFDLHHRLAGCFKVLDLLGYRPEGKGRERAAFLDSGHAATASFTDCLITADVRLRDKARVAFRLYGVSTGVLDAEAADRWCASAEVSPVST